MRVLITAVGGRGDVAPFTGLAAALRAAGHSVTIAGQPEYKSLVVGCGLEFRQLPGTRGMFDDPRWVRGSGGAASAVGAIRLTMRVMTEHVRAVHAGMVAVAAEIKPDVLALTGVATLGGYHVAEGLGLPGLELVLQPAHPTADFPPSFVTGRSLGGFGNRVAGRAVDAGMNIGVTGPVRKIRRELGLPRLRAREALFGPPEARRLPVCYGFSPAVVPRPADWPESCVVAGYWWPQRPQSWTPPPELEEFLNSGAPPVFFGFGDLTPANTAEFIELAVAAGRQAGVRLVIQAEQTGAFERQADQRIADDFFVIGDMPHDWLFPRMAALVHHAGAGTAAAGLRAGVPAVTVPVLADQPFWAARLAALGTGPPPIPRGRVSAAALGAAIRDAVVRPSYRARARAVSTRLAAEDSAAPVISLLARLGGNVSTTKR
jgi:sterol 3beta-glucosyltransferase